jgi:hypothetical protein
MYLLQSLAGLLTSLFALGLFVSAILISLGVYRDASERKIIGKKVVILTPAYWACVCLFLNLPGLALYWVAHYSTFSKNPE